LSVHFEPLGVDFSVALVDAGHEAFDRGLGRAGTRSTAGAARQEREGQKPAADEDDGSHQSEEQLAWPAAFTAARIGGGCRLELLGDLGNHLGGTRCG
jgi:hypothetical protein